MQNLPIDPVEQYFSRHLESGWVGIECLLTKHQIDHVVSSDFVCGVFVASALACIEDDHASEHPATVEVREVVYQRYGGLQGVIAELIRRLDFNWSYVPVDRRTAEDWQTPDLLQLFD